MIPVFAIASLLLLGQPIFATSSQRAGPHDVDSILEQLSLRQKVGQMMLVYNSPVEFLEKYGVGGVLIMQNMVRDPQKLRNDLKAVQHRLAIPVLVAIDQEGGKVNRLSALPGWAQTPSAQEMSGLSPDSIYAYAAKMGRQLVDLGVNINLAPVLDPAQNWKSQPTFMAVERRSFGSSAKEITGPAVAFAQGLQEAGVLCVAKHFPGYDVATNSDHDVAESGADSLWVAEKVRSFETLNPLLAGIMLSSILYDRFCAEPAVFSPQMVAWARRVAGENLLITDDLWGTALRSYMLPGKTIHRTAYPDEAFATLVETAVRAGNDMLMITYPQKVELMIEAITGLAERDPSVRAHVNAAARRILAVKQRLGLLGGGSAIVQND